MGSYWPPAGGTGGIVCQGREHICKKASSANQAAMWKVRTVEPGDRRENTQVEPNTAVAARIGMEPGRGRVGKTEVVRLGKQYKQLLKNEMPAC